MERVRGLNRRYLISIAFGTSVLTSLVMILIPSEAAWGFFGFPSLSKTAVILLHVTALLLILPFWSRFITALVERLHDPAYFQARSVRLAVKGLVSLLMWVLFYALRSHAYVYGDGYTILKIVQEPLMAPVFDQTILYIPTVYLYRVVVAVCSGWFGVGSSQAVAALTSLTGVFAGWAVYRIASTLIPGRASIIYLILAGVSSGSFGMFFGHVEVYAIALACGLWSLYFGMQSVTSDRYHRAFLIFSLLASLFHLVALPFLLNYALAMFIRCRPYSRLSKVVTTPALFAVLLVLTGVIAASIAQFTPFAEFFVSPWKTDRLPNWALTPQHLTDMLNLIVFACPLIIPFAVVLIGSERLHVRRSVEGPMLPLYITSLAFLLSLFWVNPEIGAFRDWDLMTYYGIPLSILLALIIWNRTAAVSHAPLSGQLISCAAAVCLLFAVPWVVERQNLDASVTRLDNILSNDMHYSQQYKQAKRCLHWGFILRTEVGQPERGMKYFRRLVGADDAPLGWYNLGETYFTMGQYDSASACYRRAIATVSDDPVALNHLAKCEMNLRRLDEARRYVERALALDSSDASILTTYGSILAAQGDVEEAIVPFSKALGIRPDGLVQQINLGMAFYLTGRFDSARVYLGQAISGSFAEPAVSRCLVPYAESCVRSNRRESAVQLLQRVNSTGTHADILPQLQRIISGQ